jgi:asparagine synthase (glutamine-hydrolysing)
MCGIAGILNWDAPPSENLAPMLRCMLHRGPDDEGRYDDQFISMGMRRLSIIDLSSGHQPIANEDGTIVVVFNGEIYNYLELRVDLEKRGHRFKTNTDTEVLVHLYEEEGTGFLHRLNGMFGFSIWDRRNQKLFIARDRLGIKPVYYAETANGIIYATELKSILASGLVDRELDPSALFDYLAYYYIPGEKTPFRKIRKLLPGHYLIASAEGIAVRRWWDLKDFTGSLDLSREEVRNRIRELFTDSIRLRMRSDVPVGSYLSGGLDSSLVTAAAARQTDIPFSTFAVGFSDTEFNELPYARAAANHIGTDHHEISVSPDDAMRQLPKLIWHMDEPNGDSAILPTYLVSKLAVTKVKVALSGIGGDELFGGYPRYQTIPTKLERLACLPNPVLRAMRPLLAAIKYDWGYRLDQLIDPAAPWLQFLEKTHRFDSKTIHDLCTTGGEIGAYTRAIFNRYDGSDFVNHRMFVDVHTYLPDQILALTDRMSMAVSLEARAPFLDYRLVEFATGLPGDWKTRGRDFKIILKEALGDQLPRAILERPKWGFAAPVRNWMHGKHFEAFVSLLRHSRLAEVGLLERRPLDELINDGRGLASNSDWIWAIAVLELWYRIYCESDSLECPVMTLDEFAHAC